MIARLLLLSGCVIIILHQRSANRCWRPRPAAWGTSTVALLGSRQNVPLRAPRSLFPQKKNTADGYLISFHPLCARSRPAYHSGPIASFFSGDRQDLSSAVAGAKQQLSLVTAREDDCKLTPMAR